MSRAEEGNIPNTRSYVELFMNTMKIKNNFCNGYQYEMQKSLDWGNNAYKIFKSRVEKGYISNTISYVELFMTTMKIKNNFCDGYQYEIQNARMEEGYIPNTSSYVELFMNTMKIKNFCNGYLYIMQKSWDGGGNNAYKIFTSLVEEGYIPNTISYVELFMTTMKMKNTFFNGHQYEMQKNQDGEGNNTNKIIKYMNKNILFGAVHNYNETETIFWIVKKAKITTVIRCLSATKDKALAY